jgi:hypothetical protein
MRVRRSPKRFERGFVGDEGDDIKKEFNWEDGEDGGLVRGCLKIFCCLEEEKRRQGKDRSTAAPAGREHAQIARFNLLPPLLRTL